MILYADIPGERLDAFLARCGENLSRSAAQKLIDPHFKIMRQHGTWVERKGYWMTAVYHPSFILRDPSRLEETKKDFQSVIRKLQEIEDSKYPL